MSNMVYREGRYRNYIETFTGSPFDFSDPDDYFKNKNLEDIFEDISVGLSRAYRYAGQTRQPYSVAEHTIIGCELARAQFDKSFADRVCLGFLVHDAHEAFTGDITSPFQRHLIEMILNKTGVVYNPIKEIQAKIDLSFEKRLGLSFTDYERKAINEIDVQMWFHAEKLQVFRNPMFWNGSVEDIPEDFNLKHPLFQDRNWQQELKSALCENFLG